MKTAFISRYKLEKVEDCQLNFHCFFEQGQQIASKTWNSKAFFPVILAASLLMLICEIQLFGMFLLVAIIVFLLIFCDDLLSIVCPILCIFLLSTRFYTNYTVLVPYVPYAAVPFALAMVFNIVYYRRPFVNGRFTYPLCAVSAALLIGGVGTISARDYFRLTSLYYMLGLGAAMLLLYFLSVSRLENERNYDRVERMADILYTTGLLASAVVLFFYAENLERFIKNGSVLFFKPRNFIASVLLMTLPSSCLMIERSRTHLAGFVVMCLALILTGSRSGLLFGAMIAFVCGLYICYLRRESIEQHRWYNLAFLLLVAVLCYIGVKYIPVLYSSRLVEGNLISASETRVSFIELGIKDFLDYPINGVGIGSTKNIRIFKAIIPGSLVFYHNAIIQVMGSMGVIGVMAYCWLFGERMRLIVNNLRSKQIIFGFSYAGILAMSMTNPGIFCPFPEAGLLIIMFAIGEKEAKRQKQNYLVEDSA